MTFYLWAKAESFKCRNIFLAFKCTEQLGRYSFNKASSRTGILLMERVSKTHCLSYTPSLVLARLLSSPELGYGCMHLSLTRPKSRGQLLHQVMPVSFPRIFLTLGCTKHVQASKKTMTIEWSYSFHIRGSTRTYSPLR